MSFVIVGAEWCSFCKDAVSLMDSEGVEYQYIDTMTEEDKASELIKKAGKTSLPQIFDGEDYVGGFTELKDYLKAS